LDYQYQFDKNQ